MISNTRLPSNLGAIHFIGIGGIGMSGIAEVLLNLGYQVQGSDLKMSAITERLEEGGAKIFISHDKENLSEVDAVVISSAISSENIELIAARDLGLPVVRRAEMLAELMRLKSNVAVAGSHGKTTTTSLISAILDSGGLDPTVINGGIIQSYGSNARLGSGDWMVVEADESDGSFNKLPATIAIVTNIDEEHLEFYGNFPALVEAFYKFVTNIPFYGLAICCSDHPEVQTLIGRITDRRIVTYGFNLQADFRVENLTVKNGISQFDVSIPAEHRKISDIFLPMPGEYNVLNATAAIALSCYMGVTIPHIKSALNDFAGVKRRFSIISDLNGIRVIDDYAHHPVEILAVLKAARSASSGRLIVVHQPHRYSRLEALFDDFCKCFNESDIVAITNVYSAGEEVIEGFDRDRLVQGLKDHGHRSAHAIDDRLGLELFFRMHAKPGDIFVCLGAGSISSWINNLVDTFDKGAFD